MATPLRKDPRRLAAQQRLQGGVQATASRAQSHLSATHSVVPENSTSCSPVSSPQLGAECSDRASCGIPSSTVTSAPGACGEALSPHGGLPPSSASAAVTVHSRRPPSHGHPSQQWPSSSGHDPNAASASATTAMSGFTVRSTSHVPCSPYNSPQGVTTQPLAANEGSWRSVSHSSSIDLGDGSGSRGVYQRFHGSKDGRPGHLVDGAPPACLGASSALRLSEGTNCIDYHPHYNMLAVGCTRQVHMVRVVHPDLSGHSPPRDGGRNILMKSNGLYGNLNKVECVSWYPSSEEATLAFVQLSRNVMILFDALIPKGDTYAPQQLSQKVVDCQVTVSASNGGVLSSSKSTSTTWAYFPDRQECGMPAVPSRSAGTEDSSRAGRPRSVALSGVDLHPLPAAGRSHSPAVQQLLPHLHGPKAEATFNHHSNGSAVDLLNISEASHTHNNSAASSLCTTTNRMSLPSPHGHRRQQCGVEPRAWLNSGLGSTVVGQQRKMSVVVIDTAYRKVEKIVWDPHTPYTLALLNHDYHFELWCVPVTTTVNKEDPNRWMMTRTISAPFIALRPTAVRKVSVTRDLAFSPHDPNLIVVATEVSSVGQIWLYDRRTPEVPRMLNTSGPCHTAAFHPIFADLLVVCYRKEKIKMGSCVHFFRVWPSPPVVEASSDAAPSPFGPRMEPQPFMQVIECAAPVSHLRWRPSGPLPWALQRKAVPADPGTPVDDGVAWCVAAGEASLSPLSKLWFAVNNDHDVLVFDALEGYLPVYAAKGVHVGKGSQIKGEIADVVWINSLSFVSVAKGNDIVVTSLLNEDCEDVHGLFSAPSSRSLEKSDVFSMHSVLPTSSIVLDLFGRAYKVCSRNRLKEHYAKVILEDLQNLKLLSERGVAHPQDEQLAHGLLGQPPAARRAEELPNENVGGGAVIGHAIRTPVNSAATFVPPPAGAIPAPHGTPTVTTWVHRGTSTPGTGPHADTAHVADTDGHSHSRAPAQNAGSPGLLMPPSTTDLPEPFLHSRQDSPPGAPLLSVTIPANGGTSGVELAVTTPSSGGILKRVKGLLSSGSTEKHSPKPVAGAHCVSVATQVTQSRQSKSDPRNSRTPISPGTTSPTHRPTSGLILTSCTQRPHTGAHVHGASASTSKAATAPEPPAAPLGISPRVVAGPTVASEMGLLPGSHGGVQLYPYLASSLGLRYHEEVPLREQVPAVDGLSREAALLAATRGCTKAGTLSADHGSASSGAADLPHSPLINPAGVRTLPRNETMPFLSAAAGNVSNGDLESDATEVPYSSGSAALMTSPGTAAAAVATSRGPSELANKPFAPLGSRVNSDVTAHFLPTHPHIQMMLLGASHDCFSYVDQQSEEAFTRFAVEWEIGYDIALHLKRLQDADIEDVAAQENSASIDARFAEIMEYNAWVCDQYFIEQEAKEEAVRRAVYEEASSWVGAKAADKTGPAGGDHPHGAGGGGGSSRPHANRRASEVRLTGTRGPLAPLPCSQRNPLRNMWLSTAHALCSNDISLVVSTAAANLEYASLAGDTQFCTVFYVLACLWWRFRFACMWCDPCPFLLFKNGRDEISTRLVSALSLSKVLSVESPESCVAPHDTPSLLPSKWKQRSLQWLDSYTAKLTVLDLFVPLNELLLAFPVLTQDATNAVQPRACDLAYEKKHTSVYCGNCPKSLLASSSDTAALGSKAPTRFSDEHAVEATASVMASVAPASSPSSALLFSHGQPPRPAAGASGVHTAHGDTMPPATGEAGCVASSSIPQCWEVPQTSGDLCTFQLPPGAKAVKPTAAFQRRWNPSPAVGASTSAFGFAIPTESSGLCQASALSGAQHGRTSCLGGGYGVAALIENVLNGVTLSMARGAASRTEQRLSSSVPHQPTAASAKSDVVGGVPGGSPQRSEHDKKAAARRRHAEKGLWKQRLTDLLITGFSDSDSGSDHPWESVSCTSTSSDQLSALDSHPPSPHLSLEHASASCPETRRGAAASERHWSQAHTVGGEPLCPASHVDNLPRARSSITPGAAMPRYLGGKGRSCSTVGVALDESSPAAWEYGVSAVCLEDDPPEVHNALCQCCRSERAMQCVICEGVVEGTFYWLRPCGHGGHVDHIQEWLQTEAECPRCGTLLT